MSAEADFRSLVANDGDVVALVGSRVALNAVPQGSPLPLVAFTAAHEYDLTLDNTVAAEFVMFDCQCWAQTSLEAGEVADAVAAAVRTQSPYAKGVVLERKTGYDPELDLHADVLTIQWIED